MFGLVVKMLFRISASQTESLGPSCRSRLQLLASTDPAVGEGAGDWIPVDRDSGNLGKETKNHRKEKAYKT